MKSGQSDGKTGCFEGGTILLPGPIGRIMAGIPLFPPRKSVILVQARLGQKNWGEFDSFELERSLISARRSEVPPMGWFV